MNVIPLNAGVFRKGDTTMGKISEFAPKIFGDNVEYVEKDKLYGVGLTIEEVKHLQGTIEGKPSDYLALRCTYMGNPIWFKAGGRAIMDKMSNVEKANEGNGAFPVDAKLVSVTSPTSHRKYDDLVDP